MAQLPVVMVVDDDQDGQSVVDDALIDGGFEPAIMASGEEALSLLQANPDKYRALVVDIHLRGKIDGWEIARRARMIHPEFAVTISPLPRVMSGLHRAFRTASF